MEKGTIISDLYVYVCIGCVWGVWILPYAFILLCFVKVFWPEVKQLAINCIVQLFILSCKQRSHEESKYILILNIWYYLKHQWTLIVFILRYFEFWPNFVTRLLVISCLLCSCNVLYFEMFPSFLWFL